MIPVFINHDYTHPPIGKVEFKNNRYEISFTNAEITKHLKNTVYLSIGGYWDKDKLIVQEISVVPNMTPVHIIEEKIDLSEIRI